MLYLIYRVIEFVVLVEMLVFLVVAIALLIKDIGDVRGE